MSVLRVSVTVECGVWTLDYESAVSGEPPFYALSLLTSMWVLLLACPICCLLTSFSCSVSLYQHVSAVFFSLFLVLISYHLYFPASQCCPSHILFTVCWHLYCSISACQCVSANPYFFPICCLLISLFALYLLPSLWVSFVIHSFLYLMTPLLLCIFLSACEWCHLFILFSALWLISLLLCIGSPACKSVVYVHLLLPTSLSLSLLTTGRLLVLPLMLPIYHLLILLLYFPC